MRLGQLDLAVLFNPDVARDLTVEPLLVEELFLIVPEHSDWVARGRSSITLAEAAALPLILPTSTHGLRQRIAAEFDNRGLTVNVVAEIDSLSLLMSCVHDGIGVTIKPMGAVMQEGARGRSWRCLSFSDAHLRRKNFLYSLPPERLTGVAALVTGELKETARELVAGGTWRGFEEIAGSGVEAPPRGPARRRQPAPPAGE